MRNAIETALLVSFLITAGALSVIGQCVGEESWKLKAFDAASFDHFGWKVSMSGTVAVLGAYADDDAGTSSGSAYVFRFDGAQWQHEQKLTASDAAANDNFGWSVSVCGNVAVVGADSDDDGGASSGSAYVFRFDGTQWVEEQKLTAPDAAATDFFGQSVAVSGNLAVVGAHFDDHKGSSSLCAMSGASIFTEKRRLLIACS